MNIKTVRYFVGKMLQVEAALLALPLIVSFILSRVTLSKTRLCGYDFDSISHRFTPKF